MQQRPLYVRVRTVLTWISSLWLVAAVLGVGFFSGGTTNLALSLFLLYGTGVALLVVVTALYRWVNGSAKRRAVAAPNDAAAAVFLDATRQAHEQLWEALVPARPTGLPGVRTALNTPEARNALAPSRQTSAAAPRTSLAASRKAAGGSGHPSVPLETNAGSDVGLGPGSGAAGSEVAAKVQDSVTADGPDRAVDGTLQDDREGARPARPMKSAVSKKAISKKSAKKSGKQATGKPAAGKPAAAAGPGNQGKNQVKNQGRKGQGGGKAPANARPSVAKAQGGTAGPTASSGSGSGSSASARGGAFAAPAQDGSGPVAQARPGPSEGHGRQRSPRELFERQTMRGRLSLAPGFAGAPASPARRPAGRPADRTADRQAGREAHGQERKAS